MYKRNRSDRLLKRGILICLLLAGFLMAIPVYAAVDRPASIEASGEGAIFDVKATAAGTLRVGTKAGRVGDRWRVTIVQANGAGAISAVGSGSSTAFSGYASRSVTANVQYIVLVTWDRPLPGTFPANVTVRFTGTTDASNPPVVQLNNGSLASIAPRLIRWPEPPPSCPKDGSGIGCESLLSCEFNPAGDTDTYKVTVPANSDLSINIAGPSGSRWRIFDPSGNPINPGCSGLCEVALATAGTYTIETSNYWNYTGAYRLSLLGISIPFRCGPSIIPGGSPLDGKFDLGGDTDSFQLNNVLAGQTYSINITGPSGSRWRIFDPDGTPINSGCSGLCQVKLPKAGGYTLVVYNYWNYTGSYTLSAQLVSN
jgi:type 1 fimbria pilin